MHVVDYLRKNHGNLPETRFLDGGTLSFTLAEDIAEADRLVVVDAARLDSAPGTVRSFVGEAMDRYLRGNKSSVHEVGLSDLLDIARLSQTLPERRALVGVEPESIGWGDAPSPAIAAAIPEAALAALDILQAWNDL